MMSNVAQKLATKAASSRPSNRKVVLQLTQIGFWSAAKISFIVSLGLSIAGVVATMVIWLLVSKLGVFSSINDLLSTVGSSGSGNSSVDVAKIFTFGRIMGFALLAALVNLVMGTLFGAVFSAVYNACVKLVGGTELHFTSKR